MKVIHTTRNSLKPLLRGGLAILAIALISAACSNSGTNESPRTEYVEGPPRPVAEMRVIRNILSDSPSFQGKTPNLSGLVIEVEYADGKEPLTRRFSDASEFYTDMHKDGKVFEDYTYTTTELRMKVYHRDHGSHYVWANIPRVLPLETLHVEGNIPSQTYYEDELEPETFPNFYKNITLVGNYRDTDGRLWPNEPIPFSDDFSRFQWGRNARGVIDSVYYVIAENTRGTVTQGEFPARQQARVTMNIGTLYEIDRIDYVEGSAVFNPPIYADLDADDTPINWRSRLLSSELKFAVWYYGEPLSAFPNGGDHLPR